MEKAFIIAEIKRTAEDGKPLGSTRFRQETGIKKYEWGKFWSAWGDALTDAGYTPNQLQPAIDTSRLFRLYADAARKLGRLPTDGDLRVLRHADRNYPNETVFWTRFGGKTQLVKQLSEFCLASNGYDNVLSMCEAYSPPSRESKRKDAAEDEVEFGYVYLLKSGRFHKIGKTNAAGRRERELAIQLPEKAKTVHVISTDDPSGIEAYWHNRFASKRQNGEWFDLSAADIAAFKRRKFM